MSALDRVVIAGFIVWALALVVILLGGLGVIA